MTKKKSILFNFFSIYFIKSYYIFVDQRDKCRQMFCNILLQKNLFLESRINYWKTRTVW